MRTTMDKPGIAGPKLSTTDRAYEKKLFAMRVRMNGNPAERYDQEADEMIALAAPPALGPGGEAIPLATDILTAEQAVFRETLTAGATRINTDASHQRGELLTQSRNLRAAAMALDAAESANARSSPEKMLMHQLAALHVLAMKSADRALGYDITQPGASIEAARHTNSPTRCMSVLQEGLLTLQKLHTGGKQTVIVKHVTIAPGGQAVIGNVQTRGSRQAKPTRGRNGKAR